MCGRFTLAAPRADVARALAAELPEDAGELEPRWNIAPSQEVLAAAAEEDAPRALRRLAWGLVPAWSREASPAPLINARAETVASKPSFRAAFRARRCLVPMSGFYEWKRDGRERVPWYFSPADGAGLLVAAAIWERRTGEDGAVRDGLALLTTEANALMAPVHHRMPVLLDAEAREQWMDPGAGRSALEALLRPAPAALLQRWRVSRAVNRASTQGPQCVKPAPPEGLFDAPDA